MRWVMMHVGEVVWNVQFLINEMLIVGGQNLYGLFLNWSGRVVSEI